MQTATITILTKRASIPQGFVCNEESVVAVDGPPVASIPQGFVCNCRRGLQFARLG